MKIAEANKELNRAALFTAVEEWLASKPKNASHPQGPAGEVGGPDLETPQVKAIAKAVKAFTGAGFVDLSKNPESRGRVVDIWLDDDTIIQLDLDRQTVEKF